MAGVQKPAAVRIRLPYHNVTEFAEGYKHHLSRAAAFVATENPRPVGTILQFEFTLQGGEAVVKGEAVVARETRPLSRPGMLLRFLALDEKSRSLVEKLCPPLKGVVETLVLGIDLGDQGARVAVARRGKAEVLPVGKEKSIPAAVGVDEHGRLVCGAPAQAFATQHPDRVVASPKRFIGRRAGVENAALVARVPFKTAADTRGELSALIGEHTYPMTRLMAELLRALREQAQEAIGIPVQRAVIAVPPHFGDRQRSALRRAAQEAGLSIDRIINETAAVALAFGAGAGWPRRRLAVVDLGGGSFNCSVLLIEGDEVSTQASGGDSFFGGAEFDARLANRLAERFEAESGIAIADNPLAFERLREAAARAKIALSEQLETEVNLPCLAERDGQPIDFRITVTREAFEALTMDLVARVVHLTAEVLAAGKIDPKACDLFVLVGGMSAMPLLRSKLTAFFGKEPRREAEGQGVVARGAALLGHSLTLREHVLGLHEVLSATIQIELPSGELRPVFERHSPLPAEKHFTLEPAPEGCRVRIHQGAPGHTEVLGTLEVAPGDGRPQLALALSVDGLLNARLKLADQERSLEIAPADASAELPMAVIEGLEPPPTPKSKSSLSGFFSKKGAGV